MKNRPVMVLLLFFMIFGLLFSSIGGVSAFYQMGSKQDQPLSVDANHLIKSFGTTPLKEWKETPYRPQGDELPVNLEMVDNLAVTGGFTKDQTSFLSKNGFVVMQTGEDQFADIRNEVSTIYGQPYYLTTDSAFHAMHITFDALLKKLEEQVLKQEAIDITAATLEMVSSHANETKGTSLEADMRLAESYLAVALRLFSKDAKISSALEKQIEPQLMQILAASGRDKSALIPGLEDDYSAYKPVGHYAGDAELEEYFRGMTWLGRAAFKFRDVENPEFKPSRAPLIITMYLRQNTDNLSRFSRMKDTLAFIIGQTDDSGPVELGTLMDSVYGENNSLTTLMDDQNWQKFLGRVDELPQPQINSTFANTTKALNEERSWRFMGQLFTLDAMIFQNMIYDKVGTDDAKREFPSGLDVMAVLGSEAALVAQQDVGETAYQNYMGQMMMLQNLVTEKQQTAWLSTFYSGWLYAFLPQIKTKTESFPPVMKTSPWQNRDLNSALGSWAELKHDTALYAKMPEFMGGGGPPASPSAPGYVEANPNVFYRLAYISRALNEGLELRGYILSEEDYTGSGGDLSFTDLWRGLKSLANQFTGLGDIAVKELQGQKLTAEDFDLIQSPLGPLEDHVDFAKKTGQDMELPPVPVIAAVSGANNSVLEVGVGKIDRLFVAVPINGKLQIAQGGVFTYYEFTQPRVNRLTDEDWRKKLTSTPPDKLAYSESFSQPGGKTVDTIAFRIGDVYIVNKKGGTPPLNIRGKPSKSASVIDTLGIDTYIEITSGPEKADKLTWWKIKVYDSGEEGWVAENPEWYDRAHGQ